MFLVVLLVSLIGIANHPHAVNLLVHVRRGVFDSYARNEGSFSGFSAYRGGFVDDATYIYQVVNTPGSAFGADMDSVPRMLPSVVNVASPVVVKTIVDGGRSRNYYPSGFVVSEFLDIAKMTRSLLDSQVVARVAIIDPITKNPDSGWGMAKVVQPVGHAYGRRNVSLGIWRMRREHISRIDYYAPYASGTWLRGAFRGIEGHPWTFKVGVFLPHHFQLAVGNASVYSGGSEGQPRTERKDTLHAKVPPVPALLVGLIGSLFIWMGAMWSRKKIIYFFPLFLIGLLFFYALVGYGGSALLDRIP